MVRFDVLRSRLEELADRTWQERLWLGLGGSPGEMSTFTETLCGAFDDSGLARAIDSGDLRQHYSEALCNKVDELRRALHDVPDEAPPEVQIRHPSMAEVRILARELLEMLAREGER